MHYSQFDAAGMTVEELRCSVAGIEAEVGTGTGSAAGTPVEVDCTEPGIHRWESSYRLDHRKDSEFGHRYSRWQLGHRERLSEGSWKAW